MLALQDDMHQLADLRVAQHPLPRRLHDELATIANQFQVIVNTRQDGADTIINLQGMHRHLVEVWLVFSCQLLLRSKLLFATAWQRL